MSLGVLNAIHHQDKEHKDQCIQGIKMSFQINEEMMGYTTNGVQSIAYHVGKNKLDSCGLIPCKNKCHLDFKINLRTLNYKRARRKYKKIFL